MTPDLEPRITFIDELPRQRRHSFNSAKPITTELWEKGEAKGDYLLSKIKEAGRGIVVEAREDPERRMGKVTFQFFGPTSRIFAYYPRPEHAEQFAASLITSHGSPIDEFPGSVGTLHMREWDDTLRIEVLQASYRQKETPGLTRATVSKYGGWRQHVLQHVFEEAIAKGFTKIVIKLSAWRRNKLNGKIFKEIAAKNGFNEIPNENEEEITVEIA